MTRVKLGHAHLFVRNVERSTRFYSELLGLQITEQRPENWAFLSSGDAHHELALSQIGMDAAGPEQGMVGLFHLAFDVEDKATFAEIVHRLIDHGIEVNPVDHRIGWGAYFNDPDGNGLEVYFDTRKEPDGSQYWEGRNRPLEKETIFAALGASKPEPKRSE